MNNVLVPNIDPGALINLQTETKKKKEETKGKENNQFWDTHILAS